MRHPAIIPLLVLCILAGAVGATPASAQQSNDVAALVADLGKGGFSAKIKVVRRIADTGNSDAVPALEALLDRRLYTRKDGGAVVIVEKKGDGWLLRDAVTLAERGSATSAEIRRVRTNNRLRGEVQAALGGLTLLAKDPERRRAAAASVLKSQPEGIIPVLEKALARETVGDIRDDMTLALAALRIAHGKQRKERIEAVRTLQAYSNPEAVTLLRSLTAKGADGDFVERDDVLRTEAEKSLAAIEGRLALWDIAAKLFQGLSLGSVLLLAAIGLAITFGVMGVINMAHGEMVMIGAYTTFVIQELFRTYAPGAFDLSLFAAIPAAFAVAGAVGIAIERGIIRFLYGRPLETLLATWGLSLVLQQLVRTVFGPTNREVGNPSWMTGAIELPGGALLTHNRIWIIVFSLAVLTMLVVILKRTALGLEMRAVTQNRQMAAAMGIRTGRIDALTFGLGSGIAGMAGVALSQIDNVSPNLGQAYIVDSFMVVVFGGVGNLMGTLVGATTLGIVNKLLEAWSGAVIAKILVLVAVILFIQKRPRGLFALRGRAADA